MKTRKFTLKRQAETTQKSYRYSLRKFKLGLASVAVGAVIFMGPAVIAEELAAQETTTDANQVVKVVSEPIVDVMQETVLESVTTSTEVLVVEEAQVEPMVETPSIMEEPVTTVIEDTPVVTSEETPTNEPQAEEASGANTTNEEKTETKENSVETKTETTKIVDKEETSKIVASLEDNGDLLTTEFTSSQVQLIENVGYALVDTYEELGIDDSQVSSNKETNSTKTTKPDVEIETELTKLDNPSSLVENADNLTSPIQVADLALALADVKAMKRSAVSLEDSVELVSDDDEEDNPVILRAASNGEVQLNTVYSINMFNLPTENVYATMNEYRNVGTYHDRQDLGIVLKAGSTIQIREANDNFSGTTLTARFLGNDSQIEKTAYLQSNGDWITVTVENDLVPFIDTVMSDSDQTPVIEWRITEGEAVVMPTYIKGGSEDTFKSEWENSDASYALVRGANVQFLIPRTDLTRVKNLNLEQFIKGYDDQQFAYYDYLISTPTNTDPYQPVKGRFFVKANIHGAGAAYYTTWHTASNSNSINSYFGQGWLVLHEIGHGYEVSSPTMPIVEVFNNIFGTFYQQKYMTNQEFLRNSWIYSGGKEATVNSVVAQFLGGTSYNDMEYRPRLLMLMSLAEYDGDESFKQFNAYRRQWITDGKDNNLQTIWASFFADTYHVDVTPYFDDMQVAVSLALETNNYNKLPALSTLTQVVPDDKISQAIEALGWSDNVLKNKLSLVTTEQLKATGLTSHVKLNISNSSELAGKTLQILDGDKVVKTVRITNGDIDLGTLPNGIYSYKVVGSNASFEERYLYVKEDQTITNTAIVEGYIPAIANLYTDDTYTKLKDDVSVETINAYRKALDEIENTAIKNTNIALADKALTLIDEWDLRGLSDNEFASIRYVNDDFTLRIKTESAQPHVYFSDMYAGLTVLNPDGTTEYSKEWIGSQTYALSEETVQLQPGSIIIVQHREPNAVRLDIHPTDLKSGNTSPEIYTVTDKGEIVRYIPETVDNGVAIINDRIGLPLLFLVGNGTSLAQNNGSTAGSMTYPISVSEFNNLRNSNLWNSDPIGTYNAVRTGANAYEQGQAIDINFIERFQLSEYAISQGYEIVDITPYNLPTGLVYNKDTGHILGAIESYYENGAQSMRVNVTVSNGTETFSFYSNSIGQIIWKDTTKPTLKVSNKEYAIGENIEISFVPTDANGQFKASALDGAEFYAIDNGWQLPLNADAVDYNSYYDLAATSSLDLADNHGNGKMTLTFSGLPNGLSYDYATGKLTGEAKTAGTYTVTVTATDYPRSGHIQNGTTWGGMISPETETATFTIKIESQAERYTPLAQVQTVYRNETPDPSMSISNVEELPEGTYFTYASAVNTSTLGNKSARVNVFYPDGSNERVNVIVRVIDNDAATYNPIGRTVTVDKGVSVSAKDFISNTSSLPVDTSYELVDSIDTSLVQNTVVTIKVTYPDTSSELVSARLIVIEKDNSIYQPEPKEQLVYRNSTPDAKNSVANVYELPSETSYSFESPIDTSTVGTKTATVVVTYPDQTVDKIQATIYVYEDQSDTYEPVILTQTVHKGDTVEVENSIGNKSELPRQTTYEWVNPVDTSTIGTKRTEIRVSYPDGSHDIVAAQVEVIGYNNDTYEPTVQNLRLYRGSSVSASDFITNMTILPTGTKADFVGSVSTAVVGTYTVNLLVTYPDETTDAKRAVLTVYELDADTYNPVARTQIVEKGTSVQAIDSIRNTSSLPSQTSYRFVTSPDTSVAGTFQNTVIVTYPDASSDRVPVTIIVTEPQADRYTAIGKTQTVEKGTSVEAVNSIENVSSLPTGTHFEFDNAVDTSTAGTKSATVIVSYPDASTQNVPVTIIVTEPQADTYTPRAQTQTVEKGATVVARDSIANASSLPSGTSYAFAQAVNTATAGTRVATVIVTYPDQSIDRVTAQIIVTEPNADTYEPSVEDVTVGLNETVDPASLVTNKDQLPSGTSYRFLTNPSTSTVGDKVTSLVVTYPDASEDQKIVTIHVIDNRTDAEKYIPRGQDLTVGLNSTVTARSMVANANTLPNGTSYSFVTRPDTSVVGRQNQTILVAYPDKSSERVSAVLTVIDTRTEAEKYNPVTQAQTVKQGQVVNPSNSLANASELPNDIRLAFANEVNTQEVGDHTVTLVVTYHDGSIDRSPALITVVKPDPVITTSIEEIPFTTIYVANPNAVADSRTVTTVGVTGQRLNTYSDGELIDSEVLSNPINEIITVGTQSTEHVRSIAYTVEEIYNDQLLPEESYVQRPGHSGIEIVRTSYNLNTHTGELTSQENRSRTLEPVSEIRVVGTKVVTQNTVLIPYTTSYVADSTADAGSSRVQVQGQNGELLQVIVNGQLDHEEMLRQVVNQVVAVGTKPETVLTSIAYTSQEEYNNQLLPEESYIKQAGQNGQLTTYITYTLDSSTGQVTRHVSIQRLEPVTEIRVKGTKVVSENVIVTPYSTSYLANRNLDYGNVEVLVEGQDGRIKQVLVNGRLESEEVLQERVDEVISVGVKPSETIESIPYPIRYEYDSQLLESEGYIKQAGQNGRLVTRTTYTLDSETGEVSSRVTGLRYSPLVEIQVIGTKELTEFTLVDSYTTVYVGNPEAQANSKEITITGQDGITLQHFENGELVSEEVLQDRIDQVISIGTKPEQVSEVIPFETERRYDSNIFPSESYTEREGQVGQRIVRTSYTLDGETGLLSSSVAVSTTEPINRLLVVGTKTQNEETVEIPYLTRYVADNTKEAGLQVIQQEGQIGLLKRIFVNGELDSEEVLQNRIDQLVLVGTKPLQVLETIPYQTEFTYDNQLLDEESFVEREGQVGQRLTVTTYDLNEETGEVTAHVSVNLIDPITEVRHIGTKQISVTTEEIPYLVVYQADSKAEAGLQTVLVEGRNGLITRTFTNGQLSEEAISQQAINQIISVGTQTKYQREELAYHTIYEYDNQLLPDETYVKQVGRNGYLVTSTAYRLNTETGQVIPSTSVGRTNPVDEIIVVGSKELEDIIITIPYRTTYVSDDRLEAGVQSPRILGHSGQIQQFFENDVLVKEVVLEEVVDALIAVGSQSVTQTESLAFTREVEYDDQIDEADSYIKQVGQVGQRLITVTYTVDTETGEVTPHYSESVIDPVGEIRVVGTRSLNTYQENSPFKTIFEADPSLAFGLRYEAVAGQNQVIEVTVLNGIESRQTLQEMVNQVIIVGTQEHVTVQEIPFTIEEIIDENLDKDTREIRQEGIVGLEVVRTRYNLNSQTGEVMEEIITEVTEPQTELIAVGVKVNPIPSEPDVPQDIPEEPVPSQPDVPQDIPEEPVPSEPDVPQDIPEEPVPSQPDVPQDIPEEPVPSQPDETQDLPEKTEGSNLSRADSDKSATVQIKNQTGIDKAGQENEVTDIREFSSFNHLPTTGDASSGLTSLIGLTMSSIVTQFLKRKRRSSKK